MVKMSHLKRSQHSAGYNNMPASIPVLILITLTVFVILAIVFRPLFFQKSSPYFTRTQQPFDESVSVLELLSELEVDYLMGKVNQADFQESSTTLKQRYLQIDADANQKK